MSKRKKGEAKGLANSKAEGNDTFNENKKVEIFGVFKMGKTFTNSFEFDVEYDTFHKELNKENEIPNEQLMVDSLNELIRLKEEMDVDSMFEHLVKLIRSENEICNEANSYPNGGFAFFIQIDCENLSDSVIDFISSKQLTAVRNLDFSVITPNIRNHSIRKSIYEKLNGKERMFLYYLAALYKDSSGKGIAFPNEYLKRFSPDEKVDLNWIAKKLGKFQSMNLIGIEYFEGVEHRLPFRAIWVKNKQAKEMVNALSEAVKYYSPDMIKN